MRLFFSAGEASGDAFAAEIIRAIKKAAPDRDFQFEGIGAARLRAEGATVIADSSIWGSIGFVEVSRVFFKGLAGFKKAKRALASGKPGLLIAIDAGLLNIRLARYAKSVGWKVLYFSPPGSWKKDKQGRDLPEVSDVIVTPFSWSAEILNRMGVETHWFGHPIKQMIAERNPDVDTADRHTVAVLPGSRHAELRVLLPILANTLRDETRTCEFAVASSFKASEVEAQWKSLCPNRKDIFTSGDAYGVLSRARAAVVCSGTATLEAALCRCPMVVIYKVYFFSKIELLILRLKPDRISQPNIFLERDVVPELVQSNVNPHSIRRELNALLDGGEKREAQLAAFKEIDAMLGPDDAITKTAELILRLADEIVQKDAPV